GRSPASPWRGRPTSGCAAAAPTSPPENLGGVSEDPPEASHGDRDWSTALIGRPSAFGGRPSAFGGRPSAFGGPPSAFGGCWAAARSGTPRPCAHHHRVARNRCVAEGGSRGGADMGSQRLTGWAGSRG